MYVSRIIRGFHALYGCDIQKNTYGVEVVRHKGLIIFILKHTNIALS